MSENSVDFLAITNLTKSYEGGVVEALKGVSFTVRAGEVVALVGPSGCGKSTLLGLIGALDRPTGGTIMIDGLELGKQGALHQFRARTVGFVFQFHHMVPSMTLLENVEAPMIAIGTPKWERRARAMQLLQEMGLDHRAHFFPNRVSGGERQRAAVVRAIINSPRLILADEPTGNLDTANGEAVLKLLLEHARHSGTTVIIATHNTELAATADRILRMKDGLIISADC